VPQQTNRGSSPSPSSADESSPKSVKEETTTTSSAISKGRRSTTPVNRKHARSESSTTPTTATTAAASSASYEGKDDDQSIVPPVSKRERRSDITNISSSPTKNETIHHDIVPVVQQAASIAAAAVTATVAVVPSIVTLTPEQILLKNAMMTEALLPPSSASPAMDVHAELSDVDHAEMAPFCAHTALAPYGLPYIKGGAGSAASTGSSSSGGSTSWPASPATIAAVTKFVTPLLKPLNRAGTSASSSNAMTIDEARVIRQAMCHLLPWLHHAAADEYALYKKMSSSKSLSRVTSCSECEPSNPCDNCAIPLATSEKSSFGDWLTAKFFSSLWLHKRMESMNNLFSLVN
jgi:hypothetical protein